MGMFTMLGSCAEFAKRRALIGFYDGKHTPQNMRLIRRCSHLYSINPEVSARLIYTRDTGHHSNGWWKNPDYERCLHLSISFCVNPTDEPVDYDNKKAEEIARAFWADDTAKAWVEPPYSDAGKHTQCHHYRLFCNERWEAIVPRREVYSRDETPANWKSFSEVHGLTKDEVDAPFLLNAT